MECEKVCLQYEYCTSCPARAICPKRLTFYSNQFVEEITSTKILANAILVEQGFSEDFIADSLSKFSQMMNKKRKRELQEYPLYSSI